MAAGARATLTDKQAAVLLVLTSRTGALNTNEVAELVARAGLNDDDFPEIDRYLGNAQVVAVGRQLVKKGLATEFGVPYGPKRWTATQAGRDRAGSIRGEV